MPTLYPAHASRLRRGRLCEAGRSYLVTTVIEQRHPVFRDLLSARLLITQMRSCQLDGLVDSLAWVVMPDHLHWLITLEQSDLAHLMKRLKARSSQAINQHRGSSGRLWQPGYHDRAIRRQDDIRAMARYVVANPLRAQLVRRVSDYPHWDAVWL
jgi:REP element-mobilizing transposase RayT